MSYISSWDRETIAQMHAKGDDVRTIAREVFLPSADVRKVIEGLTKDAETAKVEV